jgi:hypothetical protein
MRLQRNSVNATNLGHYLCSIELILLKLGNRARAALAPCIFFVAQVLVFFKDMINKYFIKINKFFYTLKLMCIDI